MRRACLLLAVLLFPSQVLAMPTFARRYHTSCATCHQAFPRLNAVGEAFRLNGFRFDDDERYRKVQPVELGDEAYKRLFPRALWPTDVPSSSPLSFIMRMMGEGDLDGSRKQAVTFLFPEEVEFVWAGNLGDDIAFYGDVIFLQKDYGGEKAQSWLTLKGWVQFQDIIDKKLNLRVGTVGTQTMGLFNARDANFYGTHFYLYTSWIMPKPPAGAGGLAEFEGNNFSIGPQAGIEANGFGRRWFYAGGVVNGNLAAPAGGPPKSTVAFTGMGRGGGSDVYGHLAFKIGGMPFDRSREKPAESLTAGAEFWRDDSSIVSFFGYRGSAMIQAIATDGAVQESDDAFWRVGAGLQHQFRDLTVGGVWVEGNNDHPYGIFSAEAVRSRAWHVETTYFAYPWLLPYARFESLDLEIPPNIPGLPPDQDIARWLVGAKGMVRPNVAVTAETAFYTRGGIQEEGLDRTLFVLFSISF